MADATGWQKLLLQAGQLLVAVGKRRAFRGDAAGRQAQGLADGQAIAGQIVGLAQGSYAGVMSNGQPRQRIAAPNRNLAPDHHFMLTQFGQDVDHTVQLMDRDNQGGGVRPVKSDVC